MFLRVRSFFSLLPFFKATARYHSHAFDLDCSDRLVVANQNYHACVSSYSIRHMIASQDAHAFDLRCPNRLMLANQNAHALRLGSILARQKMMMKWSRSRMNTSIWWSSTPRHYFIGIFCFLASLILSFLTFNFAGDLARKFSKGISRMVTRIGKCQDRSVGRIPKSLFWSSKTRPG